MNESSEFLGEPQVAPDDKFSGYLLMADNGVSRLGTISRYDRRFFVKSLVPEYADTHLYRLQLRKEFKMLMELNHPGIVRVYELCDIPEIGFSILMEYLQGETLTKYLEHNAPKNERRRIADSIVDALEYVHSKGMIHGDMKPDNIMVNTHGHSVKLIDFGLSDTDDFTLLKIPGGTLAYAPPESNGPGYTSSMKSDVYSLGKVIENLRPGLPYMLAAKQACKTNPNERLADASEFKRRVHIYRSALFWAIRLIIVALSVVALIIFNGGKSSAGQSTKQSTPHEAVVTETVNNTEDSVEANDNVPLSEQTDEADVMLHEAGAAAPVNENATFTQADEQALMRELEQAQNQAYADALAHLTSMERIRTNDSYDVIEKALKMRTELLALHKGLLQAYQNFAKDVPQAMYDKYGYDWNSFVSWPAVSLYNKGVDVLSEFADENKITSLPDD